MSRLLVGVQPPEALEYPTSQHHSPHLRCCRSLDLLVSMIAIFHNPGYVYVLESLSLLELSSSVILGFASSLTPF
jgi:hypothetical protein